MWFDDLMDDFKKSMQVSIYYKGIFTPVLLKLAVFIIASVYIFANFLWIITKLLKNFMQLDTNIYNNTRSMDPFFSMTDIFSSNLNFNIPRFLLMIFILYLLLLLCNSLIEAGTNNICKLSLYGINPSYNGFIEGIKKYFVKIIEGKVILNIIFLLLSPLLIFLYIVFTLTLGILTSGYALVFLSALILTFFGFWPIIVVIDEISPIKAIKLNFKLSKKYFLLVFLSMLSYFLISNYLVTAFGPLVAIFTGWLISGVVSIFFKIIMMSIYFRKKAEI